MKTKIKVSRALFLVMVITTFLTVAIISFLWSINEIKEHRFEIEAINTRSIQNQKEFLKNEVDRIVQHIDFLRNRNISLTREELQSELLDWIATVRFGFGGYIFVNTHNGQALVYDGQRMTDYKDVSNMVDPTGLRLFDIELKAAMDPNGDFMTYMFKRMDNEEPEPKLSYMRGYNDWEWIIGAGDYLNDLSFIIQQAEKDLNDKLKVTLIKIIIVFVILTMLIFYSSTIISKYINTEFNSFYREFEDAFYHKITMKSNQLKSEDFTQIAKKTNKLLQAKHKAESELVKEKEFIEQAIDTMSDTFYVFDVSNGKATMWNQKFNEISGYSDDEIEKLKAPDSFFSAQDLSHFNKMLKRIMSKGFGRIEAELITKSGQCIPTEYYASAIRDKINNPKHIIVIGRDITERKQTEQELKDYRNHLENLVQERTKELESKNIELEEFNQLFIGREFRIKELKDKIKILEAQIQKLKQG